MAGRVRDRGPPADTGTGTFAGAFAAVLTTTVDNLVTRIAFQALRWHRATRHYVGFRPILGRLLGE